jgi:hypothetical protein
LVSVRSPMEAPPPNRSLKTRPPTPCCHSPCGSRESPTARGGSYHSGRAGWRLDGVRLPGALILFENRGGVHSDFTRYLPDRAGMKARNRVRRPTHTSSRGATPPTHSPADSRRCKFHSSEGKGGVGVSAVREHAGLSLAVLKRCVLQPLSAREGVPTQRRFHDD